MSNMITLTDDNFDNQVLNADQPVLVDFTATWCGPCHQLKPIVEEIAGENADHLTVGSLDIDQNVSVTMKYGVMGVPTLILFKGGEPVARLQGFMPKPRLWSNLSPHLN